MKLSNWLPEKPAFEPMFALSAHMLPLHHWNVSECLAVDLEASKGWEMRVGSEGQRVRLSGVPLNLEGQSFSPSRDLCVLSGGSI